MPPAVFLLRYSNADCSYYAGQKVSGTVVLVTTEDIKIKDVHVKVKGCCSVSWQATPKAGQKASPGDRKKIQETYCEEKIILWSPSVDKSEVLRAGTHEFSFSYCLPSAIPSSFEDSQGYIRYFCKAKVDRDSLFSSDWECRAPFTVCSVYDLNKDPEAKNPIRVSAISELGCLCCVKGTLEAVLTLPQTGYVSGEDINYDADIANNSSVEVSSVEIQLFKIVTFRNKDQKHVTKSMISKRITEGVKPGSSKSINDVPLRLPSLPPSKLDHCNIIDLEYQLTLEVIPAGIHLNISTTTALIVGNIPLVDGFSKFQDWSEDEAIKSREITSETGGNVSPSLTNALPDAPVLEYQHLPVPHFSVFKQEMTGEEERTVPEELNQFKPRYPNYIMKRPT